MKRKFEEEAIECGQPLRKKCRYECLFEVPIEVWVQHICQYLTRDEIVHGLCLVSKVFHDLVFDRLFWTTRTKSIHFNYKEICSLLNSALWTGNVAFSKVSIKEGCKDHDNLIRFCRWNNQLSFLELRSANIDLVKIMNICTQLKTLKLVQCELNDCSEELLPFNTLEKVNFVAVSYSNNNKDTLKNVLGAAPNLKALHVTGRSRKNFKPVFDLSNGELSHVLTNSKNLEELKVSNCNPSVQDFLSIIGNNQIKLQNVLINDCRLPIQILLYFASSNMINTVKVMDVRDLITEQKVDIPLSYKGLKCLRHFCGDNTSQLYMIDNNLYDVQFETVTTNFGTDIEKFQKKFGHPAFHKVQKLTVTAKDTLTILGILSECPCGSSLNSLAIDEIGPINRSQVTSKLKPLLGCKSVSLSSVDENFCNSNFVDQIIEVFPEMDHLSINFKKLCLTSSFLPSGSTHETLKTLHITGMMISVHTVLALRERFNRLETLIISGDLDVSGGQSIVPLKSAQIPNIPTVRVTGASISIQSLLLLMLLFPTASPQIQCRCSSTSFLFRIILSRLYRYVIVGDQYQESLQELETITSKSDLMKSMVNAYKPWIEEISRTVNK